ncbi:MAG TPA: hypothetical protein VF189_00730 [Patescibacteria group bacterium]
MQYKINPNSIIFLDIDRKINNSTTIAYDWMTDDVIKINAKAYRLLHDIWQRKSISETDFKNYLEKDFMTQKSFQNLINDFVRRGIILEF